jgi:hypothetical protein
VSTTPKTPGGRTADIVPAAVRDAVARGVPVHIDPNAVYSLDSAPQALGFKRSTFVREIRLGRLKAAKRGGKVLLLGKWILAWIEAGEVRRGRERPAGGQANGEAAGGRETG